MRSLLRSVKKRKKSRVLGEVEVLSREEYSGLELDSKVEMIRALIPLGLMHVEELLDEEVKSLAGERYARKEAALRGRRHGSNPGTVGLGGQRVPVRVPRVRSVAGPATREQSGDRGAGWPAGAGSGASSAQRGGRGDSASDLRGTQSGWRGERATAQTCAVWDLLPEL